MAHHTDVNEPEEGALIPVSMTDHAGKGVAAIQPFEFVDEVTGDRISLSVSPRYSKLTVNRREYYFKRETGEFDGTATTLVSKGPIAV